MRAPTADPEGRPAMNLEGLIEFNKYTLALAAASFAYALEKFVPMQSTGGRCLLLALLGVFLLSAVFGVVLFAIATAALHRDAPRAAALRPTISKLGIAHALLLCVGLLVLGGMLVPRVLAEPSAKAAPCRCCTPL